MANENEELEAIKKLREEADENATVVSNAASKAEESAEKIDTTLEETSESKEQITAILERVKTRESEVLQLLQNSKQYSTQTKAIADISDSKEQKVATYEEELGEFGERYEALCEKIEGLLPGATSVGLAQAFQDRKEAFKNRKIGSMALFLLSIVGLIGIGVYGLISGEMDTYSKFLLFALQRSPILAGLVVMMVFGKRLYSDTLKIEEDYAHKEVLSRTFEGYKRQIQKAAAEAKPNDPVIAHFSTILEALSRPAHRLYSKDPHDSTNDKISLSTTSSKENKDDEDE